MKIDGGCHCGNIAYQARIDPGKAGICHCTDCQSLSATAFRTFVPVPEQDFTLVGQPKLYVKTGDSGAKRAQAFCPDCGSAVYATSVGDGPKIYNIRLGTARQRDQIPPKIQLWSRSALVWLTGLEGVPKLEKQ